MALMTNLEKHIGYWFRVVSNQVSGSFAKALDKHDMSIAEWVVLNLLTEKSLSPAALADLIGITRGATSKVIDKLYKKKLIRRTESPVDRRFQEISLSEDGVKILPKLTQLADENDFLFFGHLSENEKVELLSIINRIMSKNEWTGIPRD